MREVGKIGCGKQHWKHGNMAMSEKSRSLRAKLSKRRNAFKGIIQDDSCAGTEILRIKVQLV